MFLELVTDKTRGNKSELRLASVIEVVSEVVHEAATFKHLLSFGLLSGSLVAVLALHEHIAKRIQIRVIFFIG